MIDYQLKTNVNSRHLRLRVHPHTGQVIVTAPPLTSRRLINQFVHSKSDWITQQQARVNAKTPLHQGVYQLFGHNYTLLFTYRPELPSGWLQIESNLLYNNSYYHIQPKTQPQLTIQESAALKTYAIRTLQAYILPRLHQLHQQMNLSTPYKQVKIKEQSSLWGSCSSDGNLNFNYHLVHYPPAIIDYVLIHELAHLVHHNHSSRFWALVAKYDGQYHQHRRLLNH